MADKVCRVKKEKNKRYSDASFSWQLSGPKQALLMEIFLFEGVYRRGQTKVVQQAARKLDCFSPDE